MGNISLNYLQMPTAVDDQPYITGLGTGRRGPDKRPRKRMTPVLGPFSRALRRGAIDNRSREGRFLSAAEAG